MINLDAETVAIAPGLQAPPLVCLAVAGPGAEDLVTWREAEDLAAALLDSHEVLVGHGVAFDFAVLAANYPRLLGKIFDAYGSDRIEDTGIRQKLLDLAGGVLRGFLRTDGKVEKISYGLDDIVRRHFGITLSKGADTWRLRYGELLDVPLPSWPTEAREYPIKDALAAGAVHQAQHENHLFLADQHRQARSAFWLRLMSCWGIVTDARAVRELASTTRAKAASLARELIAAKLVRPDRVLKSGPRKGTVIEGSRDTKAAAARMLKVWPKDKGDVPRTPGREVQLDDATCKASGDPLMAAYADYSSLRKILSTDLPMLEQGVHTPIHSRFEELLETGRTSSSSPNLQNLPARVTGIRECFVPRPGYLYAFCDYKGLELRTVAQVCMTVLGRSKLAIALNAGRDPHIEMAAIILGCSYAEAETRCDANDKDAYAARQTGKVANFGFPGGLGATSLVEYAASAHKVTLTVEQAQNLKQLWLGAWPEFVDYFRWIGQLTDASFPQVEQLFSRRFRGGVSFTEAANGFFQGLGADASKAAGWLIARACYVEPDSVLFGSRPIVYVHDEFGLEVPEATGPECADELARLMVEGARPWLPDVPPQTKPVLMRCWSKDAKSIRDERGRLQVWEG